MLNCKMRTEKHPQKWGIIFNQCWIKPSLCDIFILCMMHSKYLSCKKVNFLFNILLLFIFHIWRTITCISSISLRWYYSTNITRYIFFSAKKAMCLYSKLYSRVPKRNKIYFAISLWKYPNKKIYNAHFGFFSIEDSTIKHKIDFENLDDRFLLFSWFQ